MKLNIIDQRDIEKLVNKFSDLEKKQMPFAAMVATNRLAYTTMISHKDEIKGMFNWKSKVPNVLRYKKATYTNPIAEIYVDEWNWGYYALKSHYFGGDRHRKGLEKAMIALGYMYKNEILTPSPGVRINPSTYVQMMSQLKLNYKAGYSANETKSSRNKKSNSKTPLRFFIITGKSKSSIAPGIYARMPEYDKPICMLRISEKPMYKKRLDMERTVNKIFKENGQRYLTEALIDAIATAK
ncbi:hypothetical protein ACOTVM_00870 [Aliarcobacter butzleri]